MIIIATNSSRQRYESLLRDFDGREHVSITADATGARSRGDWETCSACGQRRLGEWRFVSDPRGIPATNTVGCAENIDTNRCF